MFEHVRRTFCARPFVRNRWVVEPRQVPNRRDQLRRGRSIIAGQFSTVFLQSTARLALALHSRSGDTSDKLFC